MALNDTALNLGATAIRAAITHVSVHSGDPGAAGTSNTTTAARQPVTWGAVATGDFTSTGTIAFTLGLANGGCTHIGFWNAATSGTYYGMQPLTGDQTFNAAGEYSVTQIQINGSAP